MNPKKLLIRTHPRVFGIVPAPVPVCVCGYERQEFMFSQPILR